MRQKEFSENSSANQQIPPLASPSRALMIAVVVMGLLIVLGVALLIGVIVHRAFHHAAATRPLQVAEQVELAPEGVIARLHLPVQAGEKIQTIVPRNDGSVLVVLSGQKAADGAGNNHGTAGDSARDTIGRILLWEPKQARLIAELSLTSSAASH